MGVRHTDHTTAQHPHRHLHRVNRGPFGTTVFQLHRVFGALVGLLLTIQAGAVLSQMWQLPPELSDGVIEAELGSSVTDRDGFYFATYQAVLDEGERVRVWLESDAFDAVLRITGPYETDIDNDDFVAGSLNSGLEFQAPVHGYYSIRVSSFSAGETGNFRLGMSRLNPNLSGDDSLVVYGDNYGTITPGGAGEGINVGADYWFAARAGQRIRLRVTSPDFDTTAMLLAPGGQYWFNDDANDVGEFGTESPLDSTIEAIMPEDGLYHLLILPYGGGGSGSFVVSSSSRPPVLLSETTGLPTNSFAGSDTDGRVLGLFAGIADYPGEDSDLYACDDDATLLADAFLERGLQTPNEQIVLTNAEVTRAGFLAGIEQLAGTATPDDVVVIFYSGHGTVQQATSDNSELDGTDETLSVYDGDLIDHDVVRAIDAIQADTVVLAIDACHSGGFARDFMTQPGRIGIFSSDEDVLSDTAESLRAGGYLSYYFRRAVLGDADARPNDGALLAGELADFMYLGFVESHGDMNPIDSQEPLQRLVVDRGGLSYTDLLWLYPRQANGELSPIPNVALESEEPEATQDGLDEGFCR